MAIFDSFIKRIILRIFSSLSPYNRRCKKGNESNL